MTRCYLLLSAAGLFLVALSYGVAPEVVLPRFLQLSVEGTDQVHIYRTTMGLYIGMVALWVLGAFRPQLARAAVISDIALMFGLAFGRMVSIVVDGLPTSLLVFFGVLEIILGSWGVVVLSRLPAKGGR